MIGPNPENNMQSILNPIDYYRNITIPDSWDTLEDFFNWFILDAKMPIMVPWNSPIIRGDDFASISIFRKGQYQVELFLEFPALYGTPHCHPNVESITMQLGGGSEIGSQDGYNMSAQWGVIDWRKPAGLMHGEGVSLPTTGGSMLSFQKWINEEPVTSIATHWKGKTSGPFHESEIRKHNPPCFVQSGYADVTLPSNDVSVTQPPKLPTPPSIKLPDSYYPNYVRKPFTKIADPYEGFDIPDTWTNVEEFAEWWMSNKQPIIFPQDPEVYMSDDATAISLFRKGRFQVELYLIHPQPSVPTHEHPGVEVIKIRMGEPDSPVASDVLRFGEAHGSGMKLEAEVRGFPLIAIQHWLTREPTTIASMWRGTTAGPMHENLIRRFNPNAYVIDGYADITRTMDQ
jgi:hypothetical protein